jgi:hypothetical protein
MPRWRLALGLVAAAVILLSAPAHSILGWKMLRAELAAAGVSSDLTKGIGIGWVFGGFAMVALGSAVIATLLARKRDPGSSLAPVTITGAVYVLFGLFALLESDFDPHFLVFVVPGLMLGAAAWPAQR